MSVLLAVAVLRAITRARRSPIPPAVAVRCDLPIPLYCSEECAALGPCTRCAP